MDGHERPDVVKYHSNVFLPLMALLKRRMVQWDFSGSEVTHVDLDLGPGEKRVIVVFQDKSSFHVNKFKKTMWYT